LGNDTTKIDDAAVAVLVETMGGVEKEIFEPQQDIEDMTQHQANPG